MKLEDQIRNNRQIFDDAPPMSQDHRLLFSDRLPRHKIHPARWISYASAAVACMVVGFYVIYPTSESSQMTDQEIEMASALNYYGSQLDMKIDSLKIRLERVDLGTRTEILTDIAMMRLESNKLLERRPSTIDPQEYLALALGQLEVQQETIETLLITIK